MPRRSQCVFECYQFDVLHRFPKPEPSSIERFMQWKEIVGQKLENKTNDDIYTNYHICNHHFEVQFFYPHSKRLARTAYPTLKLGHKEETVSNKDSASGEKLTEEGTDPSENSPSRDALSSEEESEAVLILQEPDNSEPKQDLFSWEVRSEPELLHQDEPEHTDDAPDDLSMYCDEDTATVTAKQVNRTGWHQGFHCDNCNGDIVGFRYTCVQCSNLDLCVACESSGAHAHHYMLRVPGPRPYNEIQTVLSRIRKHLMKEFDPISVDDVENEDAISVKSEIKSEEEEQVETPAEDTEKPGAEQYSRVSSPESQCSDNANCEVVSENNRPVQQQVKIVTHEKKVNENPLAVRSLDNIESTLANTAKRKYVVNLPASIVSKASNQLSMKICLNPSTSKKEVNKVTTAWCPKAGAEETKVKFVKLPPGALLKQEQTVSLQIRSPV